MNILLMPMNGGCDREAGAFHAGSHVFVMTIAMAVDTFPEPGSRAEKVALVHAGE